MTESIQVVTPHLVVNDGNAAIEFYKKALGATEALRMPAQDGKRLMHSEIHVGGARIFVRRHGLRVFERAVVAQKIRSVSSIALRQRALSPPEA